VDGYDKGAGFVTSTAGRWPTNVVMDGDTADELDAEVGTLTSGKLLPHHADNGKAAGILGAMPGYPGRESYGDSGGASRFFPVFRYQAKAPTRERVKVDGIAHPTVKPLELMRWLVRLVTPPGGTVLEPFAGSGTTVEAAVLEGFQCIAIEREADYLPLIAARLARHQHTSQGLPVVEILSLFDELDGEAS
jgi:site-specific DNA-methyltransferase (adenine-specific)